MLNDLRLAFRSLRRRKASTGLAVATLALGIGANAAIFSFVEGIVIRPLPFPDSDRLVSLTQGEGPRSTGRGAVSPRDLDDFKAMDQVFAGLAGTKSAFTGWLEPPWPSEPRRSACEWR